MLIAMAGLPASGKSTLAAHLASQLAGVVLSKDQVRAALFPLPVLDYSSAEDELTMEAVFHAARYIHQTFPQHPVFMDGRTFLRSKQIEGLCALGASLGEAPRIIECVCADEVARQRLERDLASGLHPAKNRTFALYLSVKEQAEPITIPHLVLDTGTTSLVECVRRSLAYFRGGSP